MSTLAGVARRRNMALREMRVEILYPLGPTRPGGKAGAEDNAAEGRTGNTRKAFQRVTVKGVLSERDRQVLTNAMKYCPVKQMLRGGTMEFDEELVVEP